MWRLGEDEERSFSVGPQPAAFACRLGGRHDHSVVTEAKAGALGLNGTESADASIPGVRIWGPVPEAYLKGLLRVPGAPEGFRGFPRVPEGLNKGSSD